MQCPCGETVEPVTRTRTRDDPGTFRIWQCRSCGRYEERRLTAEEQARRERAMLKTMRRTA